MPAVRYPARRVKRKHVTLGSLLVQIVLVILCATLFSAKELAQPRLLMPIEFPNSAEHARLAKPVLASRPIDDFSRPGTWTMTGTGRLTFPAEPRLTDMEVLRVAVRTFTRDPAPTRSRLSAINLRRPIANEDWRDYNRLSMWIRADYSGVPTIPLQIVMHNDWRIRSPTATGARATTTSPSKARTGSRWCGRSSPSLATA